MADELVTQLGLQLCKVGLEEKFVHQAFLGGRKRRDSLADTLPFLPRTGEVLSLVAWQARIFLLRIERC